MRHLILSSLLMLPLAVPAVAQSWALGGHDPVGSTRAGQAVPGRSDISTMWRGQVWHFVSEENRARFEADPRAYLPAFDGLCPVALSEGRREPGDPRHFVVLGGTLYLLRSGADVQKLRRAPAEVLDRARANWDRLN